MTLTKVLATLTNHITFGIYVKARNFYAGKKDCIFTFRVIQAQRVALQTMADHTVCTPGDLIRAKLFNGRFPWVKMARIDLAAYTELKMIGMNINRLAKHANSSKFP
jgi:hypothetical protein